MSDVRHRDMASVLKAVSSSLDEMEPIPERPYRPVTGHTAVATHISLSSVEMICTGMLESVKRLSGAAVKSTREKMEQLEKLYLDAKADYEYAIAFDDKVSKIELDNPEAEKADG